MPHDKDGIVEMLESLRLPNNPKWRGIARAALEGVSPETLESNRDSVWRNFIRNAPEFNAAVAENARAKARQNPRSVPEIRGSGEEEVGPDTTLSTSTAQPVASGKTGELTVFVQDNKQFFRRDDVDQRRQYWEIYDNSTVQSIQGSRTAPGHFDRGEGPEREGNTFDFLLGVQDTAKSLLGTLNQPPVERWGYDDGVEISTRTRAFMSEHMKREWFIENTGVSDSDFWAGWEFAAEVDAGRRKIANEDGESTLETFGEAYERIHNMPAPTGAAEFTRNRAGDLSLRDQQGVLESEIQGENVTPVGTTPVSTGPTTAALDLDGPRNTFAEDANETDGEAIDGGITTTVALPPGEGPGGQEITQETLNEFLESDFNLAFGAMLNEQRTAGGAAMFVNWLSSQFFRYTSEFKGDIAAQALEGKVPSGSFDGFLRRKGLLTAGEGNDENATNALFDQFKLNKTRAAKEDDADSSFVDDVAPIDTGVPTPIAVPAGGENGPTDS